MKSSKMTVQDPWMEQAIQEAIKKLLPWLTAMCLEIYEQGRQEGREEPRRPD